MLSDDHLPDDYLSDYHELLYSLPKREGVVMTKKSRLEMAREIVARVKREMDRPRLTASVRNGEAGLTVPVVKRPAVP
jgi:hypothetical protein